MNKNENKEDTKIEYKNYLNELRSKKPFNLDSENCDDDFKPYYNWRTLESNMDLDDITRVTLIKEKANMLQENAERKEKLLKYD